MTRAWHCSRAAAACCLDETSSGSDAGKHFEGGFSRLSPVLSAQCSVGLGAR